MYRTCACYSVLLQRFGQLVLGRPAHTRCSDAGDWHFCLSSAARSYPAVVLANIICRGPAVKARLGGCRADYRYPRKRLVFRRMTSPSSQLTTRAVRYTRPGEHPERRDCRRDIFCNCSVLEGLSRSLSVQRWCLSSGRALSIIIDPATFGAKNSPPASAAGRGIRPSPSPLVLLACRLPQLPSDNSPVEAAVTFRYVCYSASRDLGTTTEC